MKRKEITKKSILFEIHRHIHLSLNTQEDLNEVMESIKTRRRDLARKVVSELTPGDNVLISGKGKVERGTIRKINRTRAVVDIDGKGGYNVPFSMIRKDN